MLQLCSDHPKHPHLHFHIVPRLKTQPEDRRGPKIVGYLKVAEDERVDEATMNAIKSEIRQALLSLAKT